MTKDEEKLQKFLECTDSKKARTILESLDDWMLAGLVIWKEVNKTQKNWIIKKLSKEPAEMFLKYWENKKIKKNSILTKTGHFAKFSKPEIQITKARCKCRGHEMGDVYKSFGFEVELVKRTPEDAKVKNCTKWPKKGDIRLSIELVNPKSPYYLSYERNEYERGGESVLKEDKVNYYYCVHCLSEYISSETRYSLIKKWWPKALKLEETEREAEEAQIKEQKEKEVEKARKIEAKKAEKKKAEELGPIIYLADKIVKSEWGGAAGNKPAMKKMAASMKKGEVSGEILEEVLWAYMFHADSTARAAAKKAFMELAPEDAVQAVKKNWKASSRNSNKLGTDLGRLGKSLGQTSISLVNLLIKVLKDNRGSEARVYQMKSTVMHPYFPLPTIEALGIIGDVRAAEPLGVTLGGPKKWITIGSWSDRYAAVVTIIETLGKVGDIRALEPLTKALELKILNGDTLKEIHTEHVVSSAKKALKNLEKRGKLDESAVEPLIEMLKSNRARSVAVSLLGRVGDKRAVKPLIEVLGSDKLSMIKTAAAKALGELGDERAVKPLFKTFEDGNLGLIKVAAMAIVKIKEADIVDEEKKNILKFLKSKDPAMVRMGVSMLKGILE